MDDQRADREDSGITIDQIIYRAKLWTVASFAVVSIDFAILIVTRRVDWPFVGLLLAACCRMRAAQLVRSAQNHQEN